MGCDIHLYGEKNVNGKWVYLDEFNVGRDYDLFGFLAGVRHEEHQFFEPNGFPTNASDRVRNIFEQWSSDGHTHSYLTLEELQTVNWQDNKAMIRQEGIMNNKQWEEFQNSIASGNPDYSLRYPYWAAGGDPEISSYHVWYVPITIEFKTFYETVVKRLEAECKEEGLKPDEVRIVFWFDN